ncbi:MAG: Ig-like domain-containing protein [Candidatus Neomarinimicrobiota bacterium]
MKTTSRILFAFTFAWSFLTAQDLTGYKFCIDPGHGGHESDDRNMAYANFWESESNLSKAFLLDTLLTNMGATVVLTRYGNNDDPPTEDWGTTDDPSLSQRAAVANACGADHFHSIHSNGYNGESNYTLILYPGATGDPRINGISGYPSSPIELTISTQMATQIYSANRTTSKTTAGDWTFYGTGRPYLGVFRTLVIPGTLSEGSFHDYQPETWRLKSGSYHDNEAWAIARTFALIFDSTDFTTHNLAGIVRDAYEKVDYTYITTNDSYLPVNNITITLNPGGNVFHGDAQNNGYFLFDSLEAGTYELIATAEGYYPDTVSVTIGSSFFNFKDFRLVSNVPPYIASSTPTAGFVDFPAWNPIVITFSRPMDTTLTKAAVSIDPNIPLKFTWTGTTKLSITSDSLGYLTAYTLTIRNSAQDILGHPLDGNGDGVGGDDYSLSFTTGPEDMTAPKIVSNYPAYNTTGLDLYPIISICFDEKLDTASLTDDYFLLLNYPAGDTIPITIKHYYVGDRSVVHMFPKQVLTANTIYKPQVLAGLKDLFGNTMTTKKLMRFVTGTKDWTVTTIDNLEAGFTDNWWTPTSSGSTVGVKPTSARTPNTEIYNLGGIGQQSMKLYYSWDLSESSWLLRLVYKSGSSIQNINFKSNTALQAYIFGDGSGNQFRFAVDEVGSSSASEVSKWYTIDWIGWKLIEWYYDDPESVGAWIGNGILDGTSYRFDSIQLTYVSGASDSGSIYFDDLRVVALQEVNSIKSDELIPDKFTLDQNYPNPFNPTTTIAFTLPQASNVRIEIFNVRGEKIRTLTNERYNTGYWSVNWDGTNSAGLQAPSGVYFYRTITDMGIQVRNMMLLK